MIVVSIHIRYILLTFICTSHPTEITFLLLFTADEVGEYTHLEVGPVVRGEYLLIVVRCSIRHHHDGLVTLRPLTALVIL